MSNSFIIECVVYLLAIRNCFFFCIIMKIFDIISFIISELFWCGYPRIYRLLTSTYCQNVSNPTQRSVSLGFIPTMASTRVLTHRAWHAHIIHTIPSFIRRRASSVPRAHTRLPMEVLHSTIA